MYEVQAVTPYKTTKPAAFSASTEPQRKGSIIHALARANSDHPDAAEQTIPSYNGLHAGLSLEQGKSKAYFHMSYNQPPSKSVVDDIMDKLTAIIATKRMPFAFLVGIFQCISSLLCLKLRTLASIVTSCHFLVPFTHNVR